MMIELYGAERVREGDIVRTTIELEVLQELPWLPLRASVDELKDYGYVNLIRREEGRYRTVYVRRGGYKCIGWDGKLYVVNIVHNVQCGQLTIAQIFRPVVRVKSRAASFEGTEANVSND